jgi:rubredoxin
MSAELVTIATFGEVTAAQLCRATLSASGVRAFVADEHLSTLNPHYMGASAGIRVQVRKADEARALEILAAAAPAAEDEEEEDEDESSAEDGPRCPRCGARYSYYEWSSWQVVLIALLLGLPLLFMSKQWSCRRCHHRYRLPEGAPRAESPYRKPRRGATSAELSPRGQERGPRASLPGERRP